MYVVRNGKLIKSFTTVNPRTIQLVELAHKKREEGGYITFRGKPISVVALHYSRVNGMVRVKVEYVKAIRPPVN